MKNAFLLIAALLLTVSLAAESTDSKTKVRKPAEKKEQTTPGKKHKLSKKELKEKQIREQMEREKKYAKEQRFYQGKEYDLKSQEVDPDTLDDVPDIKPDYDFDITDVYRDDQ